jgi:hypothetical protein
MAVQTDWVSPAQTITGRDHLGVQAVSEHLYATLAGMSRASMLLGASSTL